MGKAGVKDPLIEAVRTVSITLHRSVEGILRISTIKATFVCRINHFLIQRV